MIWLPPRRFSGLKPAWCCLFTPGAIREGTITQLGDMISRSGQTRQSHRRTFSGCNQAVSLGVYLPDIADCGVVALVYILFAVALVSGYQVLATKGAGPAIVVLTFFHPLGLLLFIAYTIFDHHEPRRTTDGPIRGVWYFKSRLGRIFAGAKSREIPALLLTPKNHEKIDILGPTFESELNIARMGKTEYRGIVLCQGPISFLSSCKLVLTTCAWYLFIRVHLSKQSSTF